MMVFIQQIIYQHGQAQAEESKFKHCVANLEQVDELNCETVQIFRWNCICTYWDEIMHGSGFGCKDDTGLQKSAACCFLFC